MTDAFMSCTTENREVLSTDNLTFDELSFNNLKTSRINDERFEGQFC